jgi:hypothetical protein
MVKRTVGGVMLLALVVALPFFHIALIHSCTGETIATLDVCSTHSQVTASDLSTLAEPFFQLSEFISTAGFPETIHYIQDYVFSSQVDKPPQA